MRNLRKTPFSQSRVSDFLHRSKIRTSDFNFRSHGKDLFFLTCDCSRDDAVYDELQKVEGKDKPLPVDEDLPGMGQYYCLHCDRYFANTTVRDEHFKTKRHKKRLKLMMGPAPHTQLDADLAAGMGMPDNGPKLMSM
ncbi:zinc finger family protein [Striga asiatica]|uniref:Zinc finger family protein n=1 Tax=Striga asiatica TaxID=4170 RepID=A0A5A7R990_STRAF|nr:zinc finger family protein [Striga asiatica]